MRCAVRIANCALAQVGSPDRALCSSLFSDCTKWGTQIGLSRTDKLWIVDGFTASLSHFGERGAESLSATLSAPTWRSPTRRRVDGELQPDWGGTSRLLCQTARSTEECVAVS